MKRFLGMALLLAALAIPGRMAAQASVSSMIGDTVRVTAPAAGEGIRGVLVAVRDDTMFVRRYGLVVPVPLSQVERVDVRRRRPRGDGLLRGVLYGAPIGLGSGALLGWLAEEMDGSCGDWCGLLPAAGGVVGLVTGTVLGGVTGVAAPGRRWERVDSRPVVAIAPVRGGVALSITAKL